jgi:site-specific DNA-cytosine methylase
VNELALFAGAGGGILGGKLLGWNTVCAVEYDAYAASVLVARQNDGCLEPFPVWDDVRTFDGKPWRGIVDVVSGGFPCTDISAAGKGAGITGKQSGLWSEMARIVGEIRPQYVFVENSPLLVKRGLAVVLSDLAEMGYDACWGIVGAHHVGAPHRRDRIWIWPTPNASDHKGAGKSGKLRDRLDYAVERGATKKKTYWPTPCANEDAAGRPGSKMQKMLGNHPDVRGDLTGGTLSADWTEWLMGWPIGLTDLKPLATDKFRQWQLSHGVSLAAQEHTTQHND